MVSSGSEYVAGDCRGMNFYRVDRSLHDLLNLYMDPALRAHLEPHYDWLGEMAAGRLDELAEAADKHPPVLHPRDRFGRDEDWIEYHPAYREMEQIAFGKLGLHAMSNRAGVLGWPHPMPPIAKYTFQYLFVQAEFGLMCPISATDTTIYVLNRYASEELKNRLFPRMLTQDMNRLWKGTQFVTEKAGGSDVGALETVARRENGHWRLYGEKWFCSHADGDVALLLARPTGAVAGTRGLALFAMPRWLEDGSRNSYHLVRLKDKLGTKSMASGEARLEGALAYLVGDERNGFKEMMDQVNLSRLSHGVRAAAMMRRCLNESLAAVRSRLAFGKQLITMPLVRRQLMKIMLPVEQALSMYGYTAHVMEQANRAEEGAQQLLRIITPLFKFRACRDNVRVATGAMEMRGGNGYIEDWVNPRLVRDAHIGVLWEGTSNIVALDAIGRAVRKLNAHEALAGALKAMLADATEAPQAYRDRLGRLIDEGAAFAVEASRSDDGDVWVRLATDALYNIASAILMAWEASRTGNGKRLLLSRMIVEHRLTPSHPMRVGNGRWEQAVADLLVAERDVPMAEAAPLVG
jgi:alkylation response protein AidB-like acyl-CoA dehydrogenase